jgi:outer membrane protein
MVKVTQTKKEKTMKKTLFNLLLATSVVAISSAAMAGGVERSTRNVKSVVEKSDDSSFSKWQVRGRLVAVLPDEDSKLTNITGDAALTDSYIPELDITYFFTKNVAAELVLGTTPHKAKVVNGGSNTQLGSVWLLPPTLTIQYHFLTDQAFQPYVGAGLNYTFFYNAEKAPGLDRVEYSDSLGYALQVGFDYMLDKNWGVNFDIKKIYLQTDVSVNNHAIYGEVDVDPLLVGVGLTYRF